MGDKCEEGKNAGGSAQETNCLFAPEAEDLARDPEAAFHFFLFDRYVLQTVKSHTMRPNFFKFTFLLAVSINLAPVGRAQDSDKETDAILKQAAEATKKMGMQMPDVNKIMADNDKEEGKQKATVQAIVDAPGLVALPDWTPQVPQFTPSGPVGKKVIQGEPDIVWMGTSPLTPAQLGDSWEAARSDKITAGRSNNSFNDTKTVIIYLSTRNRDPEQKVRMEATRAPEEKITHVIISSPLPVPKSADDDN